MSNDRQTLFRVQHFFNYHSEVARTLPDAARVEFSLLRDLINAELAPKPEPVKKVRKKAKKRVSKKK